MWRSSSSQKTKPLACSLMESPPPPLEKLISPTLIYGLILSWIHDFLPILFFSLSSPISRMKRGLAWTSVCLCFLLCTPCFFFFFYCISTMGRCNFFVIIRWSHNNIVKTDCVSEMEKDPDITLLNRCTLKPVLLLSKWYQVSVGLFRKYLSLWWTH